MLSKKVDTIAPFFDLKSFSTSNDVRLLFDKGVINTHLCTNAATLNSHTEMDSS